MHWWVGGIAAVLLGMLIILNMLAVNRGLTPLWQLRQQLEALRSGKRDRLLLVAPSELDELVDQLNWFMDDIDHRLQRSRESVANLSHALKPRWQQLPKYCAAIGPLMKTDGINCSAVLKILTLS
ncbi:hypothetical protein HSBAA_PA_1050 (plasmid) [Vreelandella sulfidaeris]|uniref:histidine kinase n=1 Tax=Vreelandella sulfidaeris TaxID=115553 RepID=A0A455UGR6_9GAMM|nr:hypothetical protein HSBAA_PA_1050 [Halomonas sulfidaeris]